MRPQIRQLRLMSGEQLPVLLPDQLRSHRHFLSGLRILKQHGVLLEEIALRRIEHMEQQKFAVFPPDQFQKRNQIFRFRIEIGNQNDDGTGTQFPGQHIPDLLPAAVAGVRRSGECGKKTLEIPVGRRRFLQSAHTSSRQSERKRIALAVQEQQQRRRHRPGKIVFVHHRLPAPVIHGGAPVEQQRGV